VVPVPGASAMLAALVAAGLDTARFTFLGFLSRSGKERREALDLLATLPHTAVIYEAPGRVSDTLLELAERGGGDRECVVAREMTKLHEEVRRGTVAELGAYYAQTAPRGEVVLVIGGAPVREVGDDEVRQRVEQLRRAGASARDAASQAAAELGVPRRLAYRMAQEGRNE
jgi:16S rRNA (cytidine1402-2'-O)-methyltransferase